MNLRTEHIETMTPSLYKPISEYGPNPQFPASTAQLHGSHRGLILNALKTPLKSLRSRRPSNALVYQNETAVKRTRSIFSLFHSAKSRAPDNGDAEQQAIVAAESPQTAPPFNNARYIDYKPMRLNRRKSFGDLLGTISHGVSLKYNSVSRRSRKQAHKTFYCEPVNSYGTEKDNNYDRALMSRRAEMFPAFISQNERAHEKGPDTEVRRSLDRTVANFKRRQAESLLRSAKECVSSNSSWESLAKTLLDAEEVPPARSTPRCEEESKTKSTNLNPYLNQGLSSRVCSNSKIVDDASIAERIQMTVDVMTRNRYINSFLNSLDQKFLDRILDDSIDIRTPFDPTLICSPAIRAIPRTIDDTQMKIGQENRTILNSEQRLLSSDAASLKVRKPDNRTRPGFRKSRKVSIAPVLVNFPDTKTGAACTCAYESSSKAMASLFEKGQDGLSSVCTYDYKTRTIQAYPLDCPPNFNELRQQGLEAIWLPMQDKAHNQAFLQAIILDDHMYQASKSLSRSDISMKPDNLGVSTPTVDVDFAQNRQKFKPPISIPISHQVDTVPLTEPHHALLMSSKENKLLQGDVSRANKDTATPGALIYGRSLETRPNGCDSRYPGAFLGIPFNTGYETEMDSISSFQSLGASSSTKADRCGPGSTYAGGESRSDSHSSFRDEVDSEAMVNFLSQLSGSSKSCDRILIDHKRDPSGARQGGHQTCLTLNSDLDPQVKRTSRESAKKIHGKATGINSATHRDATLACYSSTEHSSENSQDIDYWSLGRGMMSSSQSDPCSSSRNSRSSVTSSDEELRFDAPGFRFTAYAAELLELGRRSGSDEYYSDSTNGDKGRRLAMSRVSSGSKSTEKRKGGQASTLPISRSRVEGQNQVMSTGSRHGSSNLANHLPNIEEGNESDGHKRFARRQVKPMDTSSTNISEPPQVTISPSKKASCDTGKGVPNDNSHFEPSQLNHRSNHGGFRGPLQTAKKTIGLDASSSDLEEEPVPNERNKIAGLVEIFQTRTIISPGFKSGLERTSTLPHFIQESSYHPRAASTRIVTPSGAIYTPSGAKPGPLSNPSSIKRVPTPHSPIARPDSSLSEANTDVSSLFGERLKKFARSLSGSGKENAEEESEKYLRDSSIYG